MNATVGRLAAAARGRFHPLHRARRIPLVRSLVRALDRPVWAEVDGASWPVRLRRLRHLAYRSRASTPDPEVGKILLELLELLEAAGSDGAFLDVGANFGYYSWLLKSRRPQLEIVMVEPDPDNQALAATTIGRNGLPRVRLARCAASDVAKTVEFTRDLTTGARGGIDTPEGTRTMMQVAARPLDEIVGDQRVALVKVDVEGHEHAAFAGGRQLLERDRPFVVFECECSLRGDDPTLAELDFVVLDAATLGARTLQSRNFVACARAARCRRAPARVAVTDRSGSWRAS